MTTSPQDSARKVIANLRDLDAMRQAGLKRLYPADGVRIGVGIGSCGLACGADSILAELHANIRPEDNWSVVRVGCIGLCEEEPLLDILRPGHSRIVYGNLKNKQIPAILQAVREGRELIDGALFKMSSDEILLENRAHPLGNDYADVVEYVRHPFFARQMKIALRNGGFIDLDHIEEYIARGGYYALAKTLSAMPPEHVIGEVTKSGLRGRGGGGFPTGRKWQSCHAVKAPVKYVICNADEGDPGAYMDRSVMEGDPHSVIEGMAIGAYAIGAHEGYVYIRTEYPLAIVQLEQAIAQARECGLLGKNILGSGFDFDVRIARGSGAFVCGESSALIASIEGNPGEPRAKHIHMAVSGLWEKPTVLNNVETWANIPAIIMRGSKWFASIGTPESTGTKVFSLVGNINTSGLVEVPMGIKLKEIVNDIGGGVPRGKTLKAVQTGGPSGGCIPASLMDLPVDFDSLTQIGSIMGSGGMIVMDNSTCMVDVARYFTEFLMDESCGKCTSCREGLKQMGSVLNLICAGQGREGDIDLLAELGDVIANASLCGLGTSAPNPVLSTIKYFRDEYEAHIRDHKCPGGVCQALIRYNILAGKCVGCGACLRVCPVTAIAGEKKKAHLIDQSVCVKCGQCLEACKFDAVVIE
jgi:NADH:ubiquinone oxidoreductase subunit F (NADH-binding)/NAD-dependent dihydropyrimidine dehydrogenase PreA subunit